MKKLLILITASLILLTLTNCNSQNSTITFAEYYGLDKNATLDLISGVNDTEILKDIPQESIQEFYDYICDIEILKTKSSTTTPPAVSYENAIIFKADNEVSLLIRLAEDVGYLYSTQIKKISVMNLHTVSEESIDKLNEIADKFFKENS